ncbi:MAG: tetratricopeptide repeat protein [Gammaproteobacteria bacterium]|nr:tetratricopeptide repeat protein [Gammaproteobacteria bacterium]
MNTELLNKAILHHKIDEVDQAIDIYKTLILKSPESANLYHLLGIAYAQQEKFTEAKSCFETALKYNPDEPSFYNNYANLLKKLGRSDDARFNFLESLKRQPYNPVAHNNMGTLLFNCGEIGAAIGHYNQALSQKPDYIEAMYNLGIAYLRQEKPAIKLAIKALQRTLTLEDNHFSANKQLGQLLHQEDDFAQAIIHYRKSLATNPDDAHTCHLLGTALLANNEDQAGLAYFEKAYDLNSTLSDLNHNLAAVYLTKQQYQKALTHWLKHLETEKDISTYFNVAVTYFYLGRYNEAINYYQEVLKIDPNYLNAHINLGVINLQTNNKKTAKVHYQKALSLSADNAEIKYIIAAIDQENISKYKQPPSIFIKNLFDQYAPYFDHHLQNILDYKTPAAIVKMLQVELNPKENSLNILDLGCGTGLSGQALKPYSQKLIGIDISENMINYCQSKQIYDKLITADVNSAITEFENIDLITLVDTLPYIGDLENILTKIHQSLIPGGHVIMSTEITYDVEFKLQASARFAHNPNYISALCKKLHFKQVSQEKVELRFHQDKKINGIIFLFEKTL